jgi:hypothetical protein
LGEAACRIGESQPFSEGVQISAFLRRANMTEAARARLDELLDEALKETFPASDPISVYIEEPKGQGSGVMKLRKDEQTATGNDGARIGKTG